MSQPPDSQPPSPRLPQWRRPPGVTHGTWDYVNEWPIADHYDAFAADTPLCSLDSQILHKAFPGPSRDRQEVILDLGCGSGRAALPLAERGYDVVAADLSRPMLQVTLRKASPIRAVGKLLPLHVNLVDLECLADQTADHAICLFSTLGMIQGQENRRKLLRHTARILRPGGSLLLHVHNRWAAVTQPGGIGSLVGSWWRASRSSQWEFGDATYNYRGIEGMFMHRFSKRELLRELKVCNWDVSEILSVSIDGSKIVDGAKISGGYIVWCTAAE